MSLPRYPEYKDSGVEWLGEVPEHWEACRFSRVIHAIKDGTHGTFSRVSDGEIFLSAKNVANGRIEISDDESLISLDDHLEIVSNDFPQKGDLLLTIVGTIGRSCVYSLDEAIAFQRSVCFIRLKQSCHPQFFYFLTQSKFFQEQLQSKSKSSAQAGVYMGDVSATSIVFPANYEEQQTIAAFLDRETGNIDALIAEQRRLVELLKEKRQAVISHAVTKGLNPNAPMKHSGIEWLGDVPGHWEVRTIAKSSTKITNGFVGPTRDILVDAGTPYIQATHIKNGRVNFDDGYFVRPEWSAAHAKSILCEGDVLIVQTGAGTGDVGLVSTNEVGYNCHALIIVAPDKSLLHGTFLSIVLQSTYGQEKLTSIETGAMHPHLNCGEVKFVEIPLPPLDQQTDIVAYINRAASQFDTLTAEAQRAIELLQERRSALISAAVTGKIDVRVPELAEVA
jgi:type I restriction enzyme S subunit